MRERMQGGIKVVIKRKDVVYREGRKGKEKIKQGETGGRSRGNEKGWR